MRAQRGVGLIELMISMVIGLVLLFGLATIFFSMNQTYRMRQDMSAVQNGQRNAMTFLSTMVQNAGYNPNPFAGAIPIPIAGFGDGLVVPGTDTLTVRFIPSTVAGFQGCSDNLVQGNVYRNTFSVNAVERTLDCTETNETAATADVVVPLVRRVQGMVVLYGVATTASGSVTRYLPATGGTSVTALALWPQVKTVRVRLQFDNPLAGDAGQAARVDLTQTIPFMIGM